MKGGKMGILEILTAKQKQLIKYKIRTACIEIIKGICLTLFIFSWGIVPSPIGY